MLPSFVLDTDCIACHTEASCITSMALWIALCKAPTTFFPVPPSSWLDFMPAFPSSNRYSPLGEQDEVRIEMEERPQAEQTTGPQWQDSTREALAVALSATLPPPIRFETKPPPRRRSWPAFTVTKSAVYQAKIQDDVQRKRALSLPELRQSPSPEEVCYCVYSLTVF